MAKKKEQKVKVSFGGYDDGFIRIYLDEPKKVKRNLNAIKGQIYLIVPYDEDVPNKKENL